MFLDFSKTIPDAKSQKSKRWLFSPSGWATSTRGAPFRKGALWKSLPGQERLMMPAIPLHRYFTLFFFAYMYRRNPTLLQDRLRNIKLFGFDFLISSNFQMNHLIVRTISHPLDPVFSNFLLFFRIGVISYSFWSTVTTEKLFCRLLEEPHHLSIVQRTSLNLLPQRVYRFYGSCLHRKVADRP